MAMNFFWSRVSWTAIVICVFKLGALATTAAPPDPSASCASGYYAAMKPQAGPSSPSTGDPSPLVVVRGRAPINTASEVAMGQQVTVCVMGLHDWIYKQKKNPDTLRLFIGGYLLTKVSPSSISPASQEYLNFTLQMDTANSDDWKAWAAIVDAAHHSDENQLPISIGISDSRYVFESSAFVRIVPYPKSWPWLLLAFLSLLTALIYFAARTDLLRYVIGAKPAMPLRSPYSLGLVQMAFWFYLVVAAYAYICVSTRQIHIPMGSVLGLLGISSTTGLAAIFVDKQKEASSRSQRNSLVAEREALKARIAGLQDAGITPGTAAESELAQKQSRLTEVEANLNLLPAAPSPSTSRRFILDLLNDGDGISFHRFQIAVWTIVLGTVFVWAVYRNMAMPEFDPSLLTLMGISSGTYVGFKFPEKPK
ncbi:MAG TPA: hypothetical protein VNW97_08465 [Candidatus Saccharimonadales bacterium]|nr:hypothetical protein [Candidatus Saccharimonadales bacterium]